MQVDMDEQTRSHVKKVLEAIAEEADTEARWLNTLSLLEYVGARKISKSVASTHPRFSEVLDHLADEARHAFAFKRLAEIVANGRVDEYLAEDAARAYFSQLDERATEWLSQVAPDAGTLENYLLVTTLIERRAMTVYPLYRGISSNDAVREELQNIVVEEQDHRVELQEKCLELLAGHGVEGIEDAIAVERELFEGLMDTIASEVGAQ
ncbi:MAG: hypothetical protein ABEL76_13710 [Bradymonadaceae bacterium]